MQPLFDRVLISPKKEEMIKSAAGIILAASKVYDEGIVMATGPGKDKEPMVLVVGDEVIYPKNCGDEVPGGRIMFQHQVIAVVKEAEIEGGED